MVDIRAGGGSRSVVMGPWPWGLQGMLKIYLNLRITTKNKNSPQNSFSRFEHTHPIILATFWSSPGVLFPEGLYRVWSQEQWVLLPSTIQGRAAHEHTLLCPHPPQSLGLTCNFQLFSKVRMIMKEEHFGFIQDTKAARTIHLKTLRKEDSKSAAESGKDGRGKCIQSKEVKYWGEFKAMCLFL